MTEVAKALGMKNTVFKNASGLPNSKQVTTARDMATLAAAVYFHFPQYYDLFARREFSYEGKTYYTHNHLLKNFEGADGMKTGYIASAGFNIVTSAQRDGERVIAVTMGHNTQEERDRTVARLMEQGFNKLAANRSPEATATYVKLENSDFLLDSVRENEKKSDDAAETKNRPTPYGRFRSVRSATMPKPASMRRKSAAVTKISTAATPRLNRRKTTPSSFTVQNWSTSPKTMHKKYVRICKKKTNRVWSCR